MKHANLSHLSPIELVRSVARRPGWFLVPVVLGVAGAFAALHFLPPVYRSYTEVMVVSQKVPADYVKPTVTADIDERLKTIEQQITNRTNIERIIREMDLYPEQRRSAAMEDVVDQMRRNDLAVQRQGNSVFRIYFKSRDPKKAAATANRVAELFIQENLKLREDQAQGTSSFLDSELAQEKRKLEEQESRVAAFKQLHLGELPEQRDTNLRAVGQLQDKLGINNDATDRAETRKLLLQSQIAELRQQASAPAPAAPSAPAGPSHLDQLRTQLAELRSRYTDRHPDVVRLQAEIAQLERMPAPAAPSSQTSQAAPTPARVDPELKAQLDSVNYEIRSLQVERQRILDDISRYQARLEDTPRVEQELLSLSRDYESIQHSYESLLDKQTQARLAENLEKRQQGEQFKILDKALPPAEPYFPKPLLLLAAGVAIGCIGGVLLALLRDQTDSTYVDGESLQQAFPGVRVLATIPVFNAEAVAASAASAPQGRFRRS